MTIYCQNQNCPIENRICCNKCSSQLHKHEITHVNDLKNEIAAAIQNLSEAIANIENKIQQITALGTTVIKKIKIELDGLKEIYDNFQSQTKTKLLKGIIKSNETRIQNIISSSNKPFKQDSYEKVPPVNKYLQDLISKYELMKMHRVDEALKCLEEILILKPQDQYFKQEKTRLIELGNQKMIDKADQLFEGHNYQQALNLYRLAINQNVHNFYVYYKSGICLSKLSQDKEAIESFNLSLMINDSNHDALYQLSQCLYRTSDENNLKICHENMVNHNHPKEKQIEGQLYMLTEEYSKALSIFEMIVNQNDLDNYAQFLKAQALINNKQLLIAMAVLALLKERFYDQEQITYLENQINLYQSQLKNPHRY